MSPEEEIGRAQEASSILENRLFKEACKAVEEALITGIKRAAFADEKLREKFCQQLVALESVVGQLKTHMETGKLAVETIKRRGASRQPQV
jgi:hypothetical protein